jgi:hypothetical protein
MDLKRAVKDFTYPVRSAFACLLLPNLREVIRGIPRPFTLTLVERFGGKLLKGAEVGVYVGENAEDLLRRLNLEKLFLIDFYRVYWEEGRKCDTRPFYSKAIRRVRPWKTRVEFLVKDSVVASKDIPDGSLDFVYIDADHSYERVKADVEAYYPKIKGGGLLGGHDFDYVGIYRAIMEFCAKNNLRLYSAKTDWILIKENTGKNDSPT